LTRLTPADLKAGRAIVVVDDENQENEGDLICAAQFATPDMINFLAVYAGADLSGNDRRSPG